VQFVLYGVGLTCLFGIIWFCVTETNYSHEDDVIVPHAIEEKFRIEGLVEREQIERELAKERVAAEERTFKTDKEIAEAQMKEVQTKEVVY
jgi:hypothetical protein